MREEQVNEEGSFGCGDAGWLRLPRTHGPLSDRSAASQVQMGRPESLQCTWKGVEEGVKPGKAEVREERSREGEADSRGRKKREATSE